MRAVSLNIDATTRPPSARAVLCALLHEPAFAGPLGHADLQALAGTDRLLRAHARDPAVLRRRVAGYLGVPAARLPAAAPSAARGDEVARWWAMSRGVAYLQAGLNAGETLAEAHAALGVLVAYAQAHLDAAAGLGWLCAVRDAQVLGDQRDAALAAGLRRAGCWGTTNVALMGLNVWLAGIGSAPFTAATFGAARWPVAVLAHALVGASLGTICAWDGWLPAHTRANMAWSARQLAALQPLVARDYADVAQIMRWPAALAPASVHGP